MLLNHSLHNILEKESLESGLEEMATHFLDPTPPR